jgi:Type II secretion system (T2SS), protein F
VAAANDALWSQGLSPFHMRAVDGAGTKWWNREITLGGGSHRTDLVALTREFAMLCLAEVLNGTPLSEAMLKLPKGFPADYIAVVRAGEAGGLQSVLVELAELLERRAEVRSRIHSALIYPSMLIVSLMTLMIRRDDIERRVLVGLTDKLVSPEAVAVAVRAYAEETNRQNHERRAQAEASRRALEKIERSIKGIMDAIKDGMYQPAMRVRMGELVQQKAETEARLAEAPADLPDVHPNIAEHYCAKVIRLAETLAEPESNGEAREDIRSLIGEVVITPGDKRGREPRHPTRRVDGCSRSCRRPSEVSQARSYNERACESPQPLSL